MRFQRHQDDDDGTDDDAVAVPNNHNNPNPRSRKPPRRANNGTPTGNPHINTNSREGTSSLLDVVMLRPEDSDGDDEGESETIHAMGSGPFTDEQVYCTCKQVSFGEMIACDNSECPYEWVRLIRSTHHDDINPCGDMAQFHLSCVGITKPSPMEKWFCERCREGVAQNGNANPTSNGTKPGRGGRGRGKGGGGVKRGRTVK